jgi:hypothetical protein
MFGSFLPSLWSSTNHSLLGPKEPTLLCNHLGSTTNFSGYRVYQDLGCWQPLARVFLGCFVPFLDWLRFLTKPSGIPSQKGTTCTETPPWRDVRDLLLPRA